MSVEDRRLRALDAAFYERPVLEVARDLIGCVVSHGGCSGIIVETEAYHDSEPACHAFVGLTPRTETLFGPPGLAYVYRSYGIHALLNAVSEPEGVGAAALIRALEPVSGIEAMAVRRGIDVGGDGAGGVDPGGVDPGGPGAGGPALRNLCSGPGKLTQALGIGLALNGSSLTAGPVVISPRPGGWAQVPISAGRRIGITRAVELPWRFCVSGSRFLSRPAQR